MSIGSRYTFKTPILKERVSFIEQLGAVTVALRLCKNTCMTSSVKYIIKEQDQTEISQENTLHLHFNTTVFLL